MGKQRKHNSSQLVNQEQYGKWSIKRNWQLLGNKITLSPQNVSALGRILWYYKHGK